MRVGDRPAPARERSKAVGSCASARRRRSLFAVTPDSSSTRRHSGAKPTSRCPVCRRNSTRNRCASICGTPSPPTAGLPPLRREPVLPSRSRPARPSGGALALVLVAGYAPVGTPPGGRRMATDPPRNKPGRGRRDRLALKHIAMILSRWVMAPLGVVVSDRCFACRAVLARPETLQARQPTGWCGTCRQNIVTAPGGVRAGAVGTDRFPLRLETRGRSGPRRFRVRPRVGRVDS